MTAKWRDHAAKGGAADGTAAAAPAAAERSTQARDRQPLIGSIAYAVHGLFFLLLVAAALYWFGSVFGVLGAIVAVIALASLKQAWTGLQNYRRS
ncbi:MAG TPA: hypothetical protein VMU87_02170 [Stellaceae bacterium]|nr:hypothetical protein [Stellaceae bacterium]